MIYSHLTVTDIVAKLCLLARNLSATGVYIGFQVGVIFKLLDL